MTPQDGLGAGQGLRERADAQLAVLDIDKDGIAGRDPGFPPHGGRDDELAAVDDPDPLRRQAKQSP